MGLAGCFLYWAVTDSLYALQTVQGTYVAGGWLDLGWVVPFALFGVAAWMRPDPPVARSARACVRCGARRVRRHRPVDGRLFAARRRTSVSLALAAAALAGVIARFVMTFRNYLVVLADTEREAMTDALTGLGNRRALTADLEAAVATGAGPLLLLFDLNGFKRYNDSFGHPAGDALLARLGQQPGATRSRPRPRLPAWAATSSACSPRRRRRRARRSAAAERRAHRAAARASRSRAAHGGVPLPAEADDAAEALRLADRRHVREEGARPRGRPSASSARRAAARPAERAPRAGRPPRRRRRRSPTRVGARARARRGASSTSCVRAAELHDIGKTAIPDAILDKPGPLDDDEWAFMRRHTVIGERILVGGAGAGARRQARALEPRALGRRRATRTGSPATSIPLGARIIAVCDAFDAMTRRPPLPARRSAERGARGARSAARARQFDPRSSPPS